jgi:hypothetical protein
MRNVTAIILGTVAMLGCGDATMTDEHRLDVTTATVTFRRGGVPTTTYAVATSGSIDVLITVETTFTGLKKNTAHIAHLYLYAPDGAPYRSWDISFMSDRRGTGAVTQNGTLTGLDIYQRGLMGAWTVDVYLDAATDPLASGAFDLTTTVSMITFWNHDVRVVADSFQITGTPQLDIGAALALSGTHGATLNLYAPGSDLVYQNWNFSFVTDDGYAALYADTSIVGSVIEQLGLTGTWTAALYLDEALTPTVSANFTLY